MLFNRLMRFSIRPVMWLDDDPNAGGSTGGSGGKPAPTFNQEAVNAIAAERAQHARSAREKEILAETGAGSIEELKALAAAGKTAQSDKAALEQRASEAEKALTDFKAETTTRLMNAEIEKEAGKAKFRPESIADVLLVIDRSKITEKDGKFEGVADAVKALAESRKHWLEPESKPGGTPRPGEPLKKQEPLNQPAKKAITL